MLIVYKTTNLINYKFYVGQDKNNNPKYLGSGLILNLAIKKYGSENFRKDILEYCSSREELNTREKFWIKLTRARELGYNITEGGQCCNVMSYYKENNLEKYNEIIKKIIRFT